MTAPSGKIRVRVQSFCTCGDSIDVSSSDDGVALAIAGQFKLMHSGEGHRLCLADDRERQRIRRAKARR